MTNEQRPELMISYSRADLEFVLKLFGDLKGAGIHAWLDQIDIPAGANWDLEIEAALESASTMLVVISKHSRKSDNVKNEISHALELGKNVVPIILDKSPAPLMITRLQREDFTGSYENAFERLLVRLKRAGRTQAFEAISDEAVQRAIRHSVDRISNTDTDTMSTPAAAVDSQPDEQPHRTASLEPLTRQHVSSIGGGNSGSRHRSISLYGLYGGGALAVAAGLTIWLNMSKPAPDVSPTPGTPEPIASPTSHSASTNVTVRNPVVSTVREVPTTTAVVPSRTPAPPNAKLPLSTAATLPTELVGSWIQNCNPTAASGELVQAQLTLSAIAANLRIYEYQGAKCGGNQPAAIISETWRVKQVKTFEDGVYRIDLNVRNVHLTPSMLAFNWNTKAYLGKTDWKLAEASVLGNLSKAYFGYELAPEDTLYTTWRRVDDKLHYLPAREAGNSPNTRPTLAKLSTRYVAARTK